MKNKKLLIGIIIVAILILSIIILAFLGKKERIGYLSDFNLNINNTLYINGLDIDETKQLFTINNKLDENSIINYIFTNNSITSYSYSFKVKYYSKIFRNSDIYGVYPNLSNLPEYIQSIKMNDKSGTPFGSLVSSKILDFEEIYNITYIVKLKSNLILLCMVFLITLLIFICFIYRNDIYKFIINLIRILKTKYTLIPKICIVIIVLMIVSIITLALLGKKDRIGYLSDFNLKIDNTLKINGLDIDEIKQLFTINNKLYENAITNYIFTNTSITNYSYDFKIKYYSKIFRHSDIYEVYPILNNLPEYIQSIKMNDKSGTPFGSLISTKELKYDDKIDTKYYLMVNFDIFYYIAIIFIIILLCVGLYLIQEYWKYKKTLDKKDYLFINKIELLYFILIIFKIWLLYPGEYLLVDDLHSITYDLITNKLLNGVNPVIIELTIKFLSKFGVTLGEIYIINTIIFYLSFCLITISLYIKYRNKKIVFLLPLVFISPIFFSSVIYLKGYVGIIYVFFSYSLLFVIILVPIKHKNKNILKLLSIIFLIIGMLHRHNFIVTVYPILIWFTYDYLKNKNIKSRNKYLLSFLSVMFINAVLLMGLHYVFPRIFCHRINYGQINQVLYVQIVETLLNANDYLLIPDDMYKENKNFKDIKDFKERYKSDLYDYYRRLWGESGKNLKLDNKKLKNLLFKTILKHPISYIKFLFDFSSTVYTSDFKRDWEGILSIGEKNHRDVYDNFLNNKYSNLKEEQSQDYIIFCKKNVGIKFSELRLNIFNLLKKILPVPNILIFVLLSFMIFIVSGLLLIFKNNLINDMLVLSFSLAFSSSATAIIVVVFGTSSYYRFIYPTIPLGIISLISFIAFIYDRGGTKNFIKELRCNNK